MKKTTRMVKYRKYVAQALKAGALEAIRQASLLPTAYPDT
jgi:hypothetical protein